ncbi:MAG: GAF domain-containing protein [Candidatus Helarchaeota archaeon]|nr:GAF domain-containing protein [Candidatus Helarchaeota archaeon]
MTDKLQKDDINKDETVKKTLTSYEGGYQSLFEDTPFSIWVVDFSDTKSYIEELNKKGIRDFKTFFTEDPQFYSTCISLMNVIDVNQATVELYQAKNKEDIIQHINEVFCKDSLELFFEGIISIAEGKREFEGETTTLTLKGNEISTHIRFFAASGFEESLAKVFVAICDITDRKKIEKELQKEQNKTQKYLGIAGVIIIALNSKGEITLINQKGCQTLGYEEQELIGKNWFDTFLPAQIKEEVKSVFQKLMVGDIEPVKYYENPILIKNGKERIIAWHNSVLKDDKGKIIGILSSGEDVTERKHAENTLIRLNRTLKVLIECNEALVRITNESELLKRICQIIVDGGYRLAWVGYAENNEKKSVTPVAQAGFEEGYLDTLNITWADEVRGRGPTGKAIRNREPSIARNILVDPNFEPWRKEASKRGYGSSIALPLIADDRVFGALNIYASEPNAFDFDEIYMLTSLAEDLTYGINTIHGRLEQKKAKEKLTKQIELIDSINTILKESLRFKTDVDVAQMCLIFAEELTDSKFGFIGEINKDGRHDTIALSNPGWEACTMEKTTAIRLLKNMEIRGIWGEVLKNGKTLIENDPKSHPSSVGTPVGHPRLTSFLGVPLFYAGKTFGMIAVANKELGYKSDDQHAIETLSTAFVEALMNKRAELKLESAKETLLEAQKIAHIGNWNWNIITNELAWSDEIYRIFGLAPQEFGATYEAFLNSVHPDDREFVTKSVNKALNNKKPYSIDHRIVLPDGTHRIVHELAEVTFNKDDKPIRMLGTVQDITELKLIENELKKHRDNLEELVLDRTKELETINEQLKKEINQRRVAEKNLEQFVYAVSHELRTPISVLLQSLSNLEDYGDKMSELLKIELMKTISRNTELLNELVEDLLLASRMDNTIIDLKWGICKPLDILEDVLNQMEPRRRAREIIINLDVDKDIQILGDAKRIAQIFRIFIDNAIKYSKNNSSVLIKAIDNYKGKFNPQSIDGVLIQFCDNGIGIRKEDVPYLFKKFFRTKDVKDIPGTGLGLPIAKTLTNYHQGEIYLESEYGKGTIFSIFLPKLEKPP